MKKKVSVIMSVYKEPEEELRASIESILNQTYKNFEYIIILDNPTETWRKDLIESYHDNRIKLFLNKKNIGLTRSLNKALEYATGEYIARMDADDISLPNRLERQLFFITKNNCDLCGSDIECFSDDGYSKLLLVPSNVDDVHNALKTFNCVPHPTWFVKRKVYQANGGYNDIYACEDYDFLIRTVLNGFKIANCSEVLLRYRLSQNGISKKNEAIQELNSELLRKNFKKGKSISIDYFVEYAKSKDYNKKLKRYSNFYVLNKKRKITNNAFMKIIYLMLMLLNIKIFYKEIKRKLILKKTRG